jgi:hypothetical protein
MKKSIVAFGLFSAIGTLLASGSFADDRKIVPVDTEIVYLKGRSCTELPGDIQKRSTGCEQVTMHNKSYAKIKVGYAAFEKQAQETDERSFYHGS